MNKLTIINNRVLMMKKEDGYKFLMRQKAKDLRELVFFHQIAPHWKIKLTKSLMADILSDHLCEID